MADAKRNWLLPLLTSLLALFFAVGEHFGGLANHDANHETSHELNFNFFAKINAVGSDEMVRQHIKNRSPPSDIVIINIDQTSLEHPKMLELAGLWPWARAIHGELTDFLASKHPAAIAFDITFSESDTFHPESDDQLSSAVIASEALLPLVIANSGDRFPLRKLPPIMEVRPSPNAFPDAGLPMIAPNAIDRAGWRTGIINFLADPDRVGRRYWIHYPCEEWTDLRPEVAGKNLHPCFGWTLPSLPARVAERNGWTVPNQASINLHWYGQPFKQYPYHELYLDSQKSTPRDWSSLRGKTILIGTAAPGLQDLRPTPLGASMPGLEILATAIANLRDNDWLRPASTNWNVALGLFGIAAVSLLFRRRPDPMPIAAVLTVSSMLVIGISFLALDYNILWAPFTPLLAIWLNFAGAATASYLRERRERAHAIQMFSRFLDPNVVRQLTDEGQLARAETGSSREITILFSDIRGFTTLSENRTPEEVVTLLNRYFDLQVAAIFEEQGTLDKFIGDAIMAFWNAPVAAPDHPARAVRAALGMSKSLERFKKELGEFGEHFDIGIGIHTGPAVVGFLGASQRLDYTAIGDSVNLASRLEGQTKGVCRILVSEATRHACGNLFEFVDHGEITVKGRSQPVRIYEPREHT